MGRANRGPSHLRPANQDWGLPGLHWLWPAPRLHLHLFPGGTAEVFVASGAERDQSSGSISFINLLCGFMQISWPVWIFRVCMCVKRVKILCTPPGAARLKASWLPWHYWAILSVFLSWVSTLGGRRGVDLWRTKCFRFLNSRMGTRIQI